MAIYSKIPKKLRGQGTASGGLVVFAGLLKVGAAMERLQLEDSTVGIPAYGYITVKGERFYYCRYGIVDDPNIYER